MAYSVNNADASVTYLSDGGDFHNTIGAVPMDVIVPHLGDAKGLQQAVLDYGHTLITEGVTPLGSSVELGFEPGTVVAFYVIPNHDRPITAPGNLLFDEEAFNVGLTGSTGIDAFRDGLKPNTIGVEDWNTNNHGNPSDQDFNDTVMGVHNVSEVRYILPVV